MITAPALTDDQLIDQVREPGMASTITGEQVRAVLRRIDNPPARPTPAAAPVAPPWQAPLSKVMPIIADILEGDEYRDLRDGSNLVDVLQSWAARNSTALDVDVLNAVDRALSGHQ